MNTAAEWFERGSMRQNAGDPFEAINCYGRVIALGGKTFGVYYNLGIALQSIGKALFANRVSGSRSEPPVVDTGCYGAVASNHPGARNEEARVE